MSAGWLVYALVTGALIVLAAAALDGVARARGWPTRWIWAASVIATLVATASAARPRPDELSEGIVRHASTAAVSGAPATTSTLVSMLADVRTMAEATLAAGVATAARWLPAWTASVVGVLWPACAAVALTTLALVHLRLRRAQRTWPNAVLHGRRVRVAPTVGPAVVGLVHPEIVVPQWLLRREADEQRLVLAHEAEHVRARDHLLLGGACVAVALMPWHPAAWWSFARLRLAIELDCDARVLRRGVHARPYGEMLIDLAGQCSGFRVGATALADETSHLERRLLAMTRTTTRFSLIRAGALCAAAALSLAAACEARVPTSAEIQSMDVASAERTAAMTALIDTTHGGKTEFYVNGAKVSETEADAIAPDDIASVEVQKAKSAAEPSVIRVTTVAASANGMKYRTGNPEAAVQESRSASLGSFKSHERLLPTPGPGAFNGAILIDGVRVDAAALDRLDPENIASIEVIKGIQATQLMSDPAAKNGIIKVTTLRAKE